MKVYLLGKRSEHAFDFTVFYFPEEKVLFEGELVWIENDKPLEKASKRQAALYNFITELHLDVKTIVQSWPLSAYHVKSVVSFDDLKRSVTMAP